MGLRRDNKVNLYQFFEKLAGWTGSSQNQKAITGTGVTGKGLLMTEVRTAGTGSYGYAH